MKGQGQSTSGVIDGEPTDARFKGILTDASVSGCNLLIPFYTNMPPGHLCRHESDLPPFPLPVETRIPLG
jgi:hypothetical protein